MSLLGTRSFFIFLIQALARPCSPGCMLLSESGKWVRYSDRVAYDMLSACGPVRLRPIYSPRYAKAPCGSSRSRTKRGGGFLPSSRGRRRISTSECECAVWLVLSHLLNPIIWPKELLVKSQIQLFRLCMRGWREGQRKGRKKHPADRAAVIRGGGKWVRFLQCKTR